MTDTTVKPNILIVKLDETGYYSDEDLIKRSGGVIFGVYLYDANRHVHCCEATPSYELHFIESQPAGVPGDEEGRERLYDDLMESDADTEPIMYRHVRSIDPIEEVKEGKFPDYSHRFKLSHLEGHDWGETSDEAVEEAMEWVRANSV